MEKKWVRIQGDGHTFYWINGRKGFLYQSNVDPTVWKWRNNIVYAINKQAAVELLRTLNVKPQNVLTLYTLMILVNLDE
ncbi:hypothetical protein [Desertibacillus haloalkaliphilus]|uniref:hypothetical protein n=1 Tax=Desertibacillus haloalkaliphilus TaxID=1328930 RepID=UPI001C2635AB|nr:hypothetical protein [Desertibacillus haloalkaliphilus]MBU8907849.1 hypothetical protein [Desertibacillus haloalkaliphilus]